MSFGEDFLKGFFGSDYLKDYRHASKTFRSNGYQLAPRKKFLFHTFFNINTAEIPRLGTDGIFASNNVTTLGLLVKNVKLPSYSIDVETMNQYNRKRQVQSKIQYDPIDITFHDDSSDLIRSLWYNYFSYYYKDPTQQYRNPTTNGAPTSITGDGNGSSRFSYNSRDIYAPTRTQNDWGYVGESYSDSNSQFLKGGKPIFFRDITIFGFNQHNFVAYVLINPLITSWAHDTFDYSDDTGIMEHTVTLQYETVKYFSGALGSDPEGIAPGFATDAYYDKVKSALARPGSTASILGQGGLIDAIGGIVNDLQSGSVSGVIGAIQKAGTAFDTFRGKNLQSIIEEEGRGVIEQVIRSEGPSVINKSIEAVDATVFPVDPADQGPNPKATNTLKPADQTTSGPETVQPVSTS